VKAIVCPPPLAIFSHRPRCNEQLHNIPKQAPLWWTWDVEHKHKQVIQATRNGNQHTVQMILAQLGVVDLKTVADIVDKNLWTSLFEAVLLSINHHVSIQDSVGSSIVKNLVRAAPCPHATASAWILTICCSCLCRQCLKSPSWTSLPCSNFATTWVAAILSPPTSNFIAI
jgi:hypothetical protein